MPYVRIDKHDTHLSTNIDNATDTVTSLHLLKCSIDILASKLVVSNHIYENSSQGPSRGFKSSSGTRKDRTTNGDIRIYSMNHIETRVDANGNIYSSQERIVDQAASREATIEGDDGLNLNGKGGGISKTVEFEFHESAV